MKSFLLSRFPQAVMGFSSFIYLFRSITYFQNIHKYGSLIVFKEYANVNHRDQENPCPVHLKLQPYDLLENIPNQSIAKYILGNGNDAGDGLFTYIGPAHFHSYPTARYYQWHGEHVMPLSQCDASKSR